MTVTRTGVFRILSQGSDNRWREFKSETEKALTNSELLTHATACADMGNTFLLATHDVSDKLRIYRIHVDVQKEWISTQHLHTLNDFYPTVDTDTVVSSPNAPSQRYLLSHLSLFSPILEIKAGAISPPALFLGFSCLPDQSDEASPHVGGSTVFSRWKLHETQSALHPAFEQFAKKKANAQFSYELPVR